MSPGMNKSKSPIKRVPSMARYIRDLRAKSDTSLADFAAKLKISISHLCDIEHGRRRLSVARAADWARMLKQPAREFVELVVQDEIDTAELPLRVAITDKPKRRG